MTSTAKSQGPLFTRRALFTLIWPLLLEQTLSVTMGMADTLMVAGVGEAAVSSVSLVDSLNILIIQILSALATGGAVIASQYLGRRDEENASRQRRPAVQRAGHLYGCGGCCLYAALPPDPSDGVRQH